MVVGDHLPDDQKEEFIRARLVPGAVIYLHCRFTTPPKLKYLLVARVSAETAVLVINSQIPAFKQVRPHLRECQVCIDVANHDFLEHDSFIDCTEAHYCDTTAVIEEMMADLGKYKGGVSAEVRALVVTAIAESYTMTEGEKPPLIAALRT